MTTLLRTLGVCLAIVGGWASAQTPTTPAQDTMTDTVLLQLETRRDAAATTSGARERRFEDARDTARAELTRERGAVDALERRHAALLDALAQAETQLVELEARLESGARDERDLYDAARLAARDTGARLTGSLLSAQWPERLGRLAALGQGTGPVSPEEIEALWLILLNDMTQAGRIARFEGRVDGMETASAPVTRVGTFGAYTADGTAARWDPVFADLRTAPQTTTAPSFDEPLADIVIDPFGGSLTLLEARRPTPRQLVDQGGWIARLILALAFAGVIVAVYRAVVLARVPPAPAPSAALERIQAAWQRASTQTTDEMIAALGYCVAGEAARLERGQPLLKLLAALCPLLGLLGTVTGMIALFRTIAIAGTGQPAYTAGAVAQALVTTLLGIAAAIGLMLLHAALASRSRRLIDRLDAHAAGIVANHKAVRVAARRAAS